MKLKQHIDIILAKQVRYKGRLMSIEQAMKESDAKGYSRLSFSLWLRVNYPDWIKAGGSSDGQ